MACPGGAFHAGFGTGLGTGFGAGRRCARDGVDLRRDLLDAAPDVIAAEPDLQQYLNRGSPRQLPETARLRLATIAGVEADTLIDDDLRTLREDAPEAAVAVPMFDVSAAAGGGRTEHDGAAAGALAFPAPLLRRITSAPASGLRLITISGDSMAPTLEHGDMVMVDTNRVGPSPPGIFVLDDGVGLVAKRVDAIPNTSPQLLRLSSDNPAYSNYQRRIDEVRVIGRVVWFARSL